MKPPQEMSRIKALTFGGLRCTMELFICQEQCLIPHTGLFKTTPGSGVQGVVQNHQECLFQAQLFGLSWRGLPVSLDVGMRGPWSTDRASLRQPYNKNQRQTFQLCVGGKPNSGAPSTEPISEGSSQRICIFNELPGDSFAHGSLEMGL